MEEKRVKFVCETTGWNYEKSGNSSVCVSISSDKFCFQDRNRPKEIFTFKIYSASFEDVYANVCGADRDFDISEYAFYLQKEYLEKNPEMVVPPILSITKFSEFVEQKLSLLNVSLVANLATDTFERKIIKLAEKNNLDVFIENKTMSDVFQFWNDGIRLVAYVENEFDENGYVKSDDKYKAKALSDSLLYDMWDVDSYVFSERKSGDEKRKWGSIVEIGKNLISDISNEFGIEVNDSKKTEDDEALCDFGDEWIPEF